MSDWAYRSALSLPSFHNGVVIFPQSINNSNYDFAVTLKNVIAVNDRPIPYTVFIPGAEPFHPVSGLTNKSALARIGSSSNEQYLPDGKAENVGVAGD